MSFRQSLRDRCNILLRVSTDRKPSSTKSKLPPNLTSSAGNTPPYLPPALPNPRAISPPPLPSGPMETLEDLPSNEDAAREFIPYLYLFSPSSPDTQALPAGSWTHIIYVLPASPEHPVGTKFVTDGATNGGTQLLDLYIAPAPLENTSALPLSTRHLLVARDFLALALPYYGCAHPTDDETALDSPTPLEALDPPPAQHCRTDAVRVLLCGPPRAVLVIAVAYIAYASGCTVAHVMRCVVDEDEDAESCALLGPDAQMGLGSREMRVLERVVKKEL
ncbi:hypothetical protein B0H11DRAFT_260129 [Mycena galericulata]|nr:hypothetical protein B0H11DRAFT_260129 [Mycena galericulata]